MGAWFGSAWREGEFASLGRSGGRPARVQIHYLPNIVSRSQRFIRRIHCGLHRFRDQDRRRGPSLAQFKTIGRSFFVRGPVKRGWIDAHRLMVGWVRRQFSAFGITLDDGDAGPKCLRRGVPGKERQDDSKTASGMKMKCGMRFVNRGLHQIGPVSSNFENPGKLLLNDKVRPALSRSRKLVPFSATLGGVRR